MGPTGRTQMSTVCFLASEDGAVRLSLNASRQKSRNMVGNPMVALHILDTDEPSRYLELRGGATVESDENYAFADQLGAKYGGLDLRDMDRPGAPDRGDGQLDPSAGRRHARSGHRRVVTESLKASDELYGVERWTILNLVGDATDGFTGLVCLAVDPHRAPPSSPTDEAG